MRWTRARAWTLVAAVAAAVGLVGSAIWTAHPQLGETAAYAGARPRIAMPRRESAPVSIEEGAGAARASVVLEEPFEWPPLAGGDEERPQAAADTQLAAWVADLRDDHLQGNATSALEQLDRHFAQAESALIDALDSDDEQQRKLAAYLLATRRSRRGGERLAIALVEALSPDDLPLARTPPSWLPKGGVAYTRVHNASAAADWLLHEKDLARAPLERVWREQTAAPLPLVARLAIASCLALDERSSYSADACRLLIDRLRDNDIAQDAMLAFDVLLEVGVRALPLVDDAWSAADAQQRQLLARWFAEVAPADRRGTGHEQTGWDQLLRYGASDSLCRRWLARE